MLRHFLLKRLGVFPSRLLFRFQWQEKNRSKHRRFTQRATLPAGLRTQKRGIPDNFTAHSRQNKVSSPAFLLGGVLIRGQCLQWPLLLLERLTHYIEYVGDGCDT